VWAEGDSVRDTKSGKRGTVVQVTGPAPFIYRVKVAGESPGQPPIMLYRYGHQLRGVPARSPVGERASG
jgi:hypothetical protein